MKTSRDRGMVLITVLWIVLILSLISFSLAAAVRVEVNSSRNSFDSERAFYMAKGAAEVVYNAYEKNQRIPDNTPVRRENDEYIFPFDLGEARVRLESNAGRIDINVAPDQLIGSMFDSLGVSEETRNRLVDSMRDWRDPDDIPHLYGAEVNDYPQRSGGLKPLPKNGTFQNVDELLLVKNMTPELFYGSFVVESATGEYRRIPGVKDLVTVYSRNPKIDANEASREVLLALPAVASVLADRILEERTREKFADAADLANRIPELAASDALQHLMVGAAAPSMIVSRATIASSGVSRTVSLLFKREEKVQILLYMPLLYRKTTLSKFDRWRFE